MMYVDDIVIIAKDAAKISHLKEHLCNHFQTRNHGNLKYFWDIKVSQSKEGVLISKRKYALDQISLLLDQICLL